MTILELAREAYANLKLDRNGPTGKAVAPLRQYVIDECDEISPPFVLVNTAAVLNTVPAALANAAEHKAVILAPSTGLAVISGRTFPYLRRWSDERFEPADGYLAFDTETELIPDDPAAPPPRLALATASAGDQDSCLIHLDDVGRFILKHRDLQFVCHNVAFDFWVVEEHLRRRNEQGARQAWWTLADEGRLHDSMLLDALLERFLVEARRVEISEGTFRQARSRLDDGDIADVVQRALSLFVVARLSMSGRQKNFAPPSKTGRLRRGMDERQSSWLSALDRLPTLHARLQRVILRNQPALECIREFDGRETLVYADPPYVHSTRASTDTYSFEMSDKSHRELLESIKDCQGAVVLSGYRNPLDDRELVGWERREFEVPNDGAAGRTKRRMTECLWIKSAAAVLPKESTMTPASVLLEDRGR